MLDQTIDQLHTFLKDLNKKVEKLGYRLDRLDILTYRYKRLSTVYKELSAQCYEIAETIDRN